MADADQPSRIQQRGAAIRFHWQRLRNCIGTGGFILLLSVCPTAGYAAQTDAGREPSSVLKATLVLLWLPMLWQVVFGLMFLVAALSSHRSVSKVFGKSLAALLWIGLFTWVLAREVANWDLALWYVIKAVIAYAIALAIKGCARMVRGTARAVNGVSAQELARSAGVATARIDRRASALLNAFRQGRRAR
jgi:hypothetical protein